MNHSKQFLNDFCNLRISKAEHGVGSFVDLYFSEGNESPSGHKAHLWIYLCDWWMRTVDGDILNHDSIGNDATEEILRTFIGATLIDFSIDEDLLGATFGFSNGVNLFLKADIESYELDDLFLVFVDETPRWGFVPKSGLRQIDPIPSH